MMKDIREYEFKYFIQMIDSCDIYVARKVNRSNNKCVQLAELEYSNKRGN